MQARRTQAAVRLDFSLFEAGVLTHILTVLRDSYNKRPSELDPQTAGSWYSMRGFKSAGMSAEEKEDWLTQMHEHRRGRVGVIEKVLKGLATAEESKRAEIDLSLDETGDLMVALNDYRLRAAARNQIGQEEMDAMITLEKTSLPLRQQAALAEIHFLAYLVEILIELLQSAPPETPPSAD